MRYLVQCDGGMTLPQWVKKSDQRWFSHKMFEAISAACEATKNSQVDMDRGRLTLDGAQWVHDTSMNLQRHEENE